MTDRPSWQREGRDWPHREASQFVNAGGVRWHVQRMGRGPAMLLVHGTGAATHSWRALAPLLAKRFEVIAPDLPGHGFSAPLPPGRMSLPGMADALGALLQKLGVRPAVAVGHSAGAAVLARMILDDAIAPRSLVGLNAALLPLRGVAGHVFAPAARLLAASSLAARVFAWRAADRALVEKLVLGTGSRVDAEGVELYARLVRKPGHVAAALDMMANWDLHALAADLPALQTPLTLIVGERDRTVAPAEARRVQAVVPHATVITLPGLGHLAHEEQPVEVARLLVRLSAAA
jgi:magnesium chelatase accessory protein